MKSWINAWIVPGAVFQSVTVGGGYGTGREVVEFISRFGPWGGLAAVLLIGALMGLVLAIAFDFARCFQLQDYRAYGKALIGRFWVLYEVGFMISLVLILAIAGSAAGEVLQNSFGVPAGIGVGLMLLIIAVLNYSGREWVEATLTFWGVLMSLLFVTIVVLTVSFQGEQIAATFRAAQLDLSGSWWRGGFQFFLYTVALAPTVIYATDHIESRRQAWGAGLIAGGLTILPGLTFHLTFMAGYPEVLGQSVPTYWILQQLGLPVLLLIYVLVLFGTIAQTGAGMLQGLNERLDSWWLEIKGRPLKPRIHSSIAIVAVLLSLLLAKLGIVTLVAKGYGSLAWGSLVTFVVPLLTIGVWKMRQQRIAFDAAPVNASNK